MAVAVYIPRELPDLRYGHRQTPAARSVASLNAPCLRQGASLSVIERAFTPAYEKCYAHQSKVFACESQRIAPRIPPAHTARGAS